RAPLRGRSYGSHRPRSRVLGFVHFRRGRMQVTFSQTAEAMLGPYRQSREVLLAALAGLPGSCFIDGKVGRIAGNGELTLRSPDHRPTTTPHAEFSDPVRLGRAIEEWSSSGPA